MEFCIINSEAITIIIVSENRSADAFPFVSYKLELRPVTL